ncbi:MAG: hypothetical protein ACE5IM_12365 [Nitrospinota bacterium]
MTQSRRSKALLFSFLSATLLAAPLFATPAYSEDIFPKNSIFSSFYKGPFLQCKQTKKVDHGGCWILKNGEEAKARCTYHGNPGGTHWKCKPAAAFAKAKAKAK